MENTVFEDRAKFKYMLFRLGGEVYGTPLLSVREVIEKRMPKAVPNSSEGFEGVINLRGDVIGIVDFRTILKIKPQESLSILVFESEMGTLGGIVDKCISVVEIPDSNIERRNHDMRDSTACYLGIGKIPDGLVTIIDLVKVASQIMVKV